MKPRPVLFLAVLSLLVPVALDSGAAHAQDIGLPQLFRLNLPDVDEPANAAMDKLAEGMSLTITALNAGKKAKVPAAPEYGERALQDFDQARETLMTVSLKIPLRKVNAEVIRKSQYAKAYDELVIALREAGYPEPTDSKSFFGILIGITDHYTSDLKQLMSPPSGLQGQQAMVSAFLDLIKQKILLERIGSTSGIITIAMQG